MVSRDPDSAVPPPRSLFRLAVVVLVSLAAGSSPAAAGTGIVALDEAAIPVKAPSHVYLDTITRAGARLVAAGEHGVITYSDDNGVTWRQASVPVDATLTDVVFSSPQEGWAVGNSGVILHSRDAGVTWQLKLNGIQANQLTLAAAKEAMSSNSTAAGASRALNRANIFMAQGPNKPFLSILLLNDHTIMVFGAYRMVMRSDDGGANWYDSSLAIGDPVSHNLYQAIKVGQVIYVAGEDGLVFGSTDGGNSFPALASPAAATLFGLFTTPRKLFAYGVAGGLFQSGDGGKSWQQVAVGTSVNLMAEATLTSGKILLAAESGVVFASRDQGKTFDALPDTVPMALYDIVQAANGDVIGVGNFGVVKIPVSSPD